MAKKPDEIQLYQLRLGLATRKNLLDTHVAVAASSPHTMDEATTLAAAVRDMVNADTGEAFEIQFIKCIGTTYVWK